MQCGYWTAVVTHFAQERRAAEHAHRQGFDYYLPETMNGARQERLFPNYLFVFITGQWRVLLGTRGIRRLILNNEHPVRMPEREIAALRERENGKGLIELPPPFTPGQETTIVGGMFNGRRAIVKGMPAHDRVSVLLELLGRKVSLTLDKDMVAA